MQVSEIVWENGNYQIEDIFGFEQTGVDNDGVAVGEFFATGHQPKCLQRVRAAGIMLPDDMFAPRRFGCNIDDLPALAGSVNGNASYLTR